MVDVADRVVVELIAKNAAYDASVKGSADNFERSSGRIVKAANDVERSGARVANASRNIGRQIADIGAQASGGQSPFLIFAQQAPQLADALADTGGKAAKVAAFFAGPWGAALLAAGSIVGVFIGKLLDSGDAADTAAKKYDYAKEAVNRLAAAQRALQGAGFGSNRDTIASAVGSDEIELRRLQAQRGKAGTRGDRNALDVQIGQTQVRIEQNRELLKQDDARISATNRIKAAEDAAEDARRQREKAERTGLSDAKKAAREREAAAKKEAKAWDDARKAVNEYVLSIGQGISRDFERDFNRRSDEGFKATMDDVNQRRGGEQDQAGATFEAEQQRMKDNVQTLADLYETAFNRGTKGIAELFKQEMSRAVAVSLAKFTISKLGSLLSAPASGTSTSGIAGLLSQVASSFGGPRANGGPVSPGQTYLVGERGPELLRMGGRGGVVIPNHAAAVRGGGGNIIVQQSFVLDARYGITTPELLDHVENVRREAVGTAAAAGRAAYRASPDAVARQQVLGNV